MIARWPAWQVRSVSRPAAQAYRWPEAAYDRKPSWSLATDFPSVGHGLELALRGGFMLSTSGLSVI